MTRRSSSFLPVLTALFAVGVVAALGSIRYPSPPSSPRPMPQASSPAPVVYPNPYDSVQQFMEGLYAADRDVEPSPDHRIRGVVVPHHLVAAPAVASGLKALHGQRFKRILLLSPDHFHRCRTTLCTVDGVYKTAFGDVGASQETLAVLRASRLVTEDQDLFRAEHGIHAVIPFIAHFFPGTPVTPLALSQRAGWKAERAGLLDILAQAVDDDTILIVSSDFSHYLSSSAADEMDERTAKALFANDLAGIAELRNPEQSDCPGCLWLLAKLAADRGFYNPSVMMHTNSADILQDDRIPETTSHFSMVWYENAALDGGDLAAAGDVTFARVEAPSLSEDLRAWWTGSGPRLVNLEGPIAERCAPRKNPFLFCNALSAWSAAKDLATHWGVENNHMLDLGDRGHGETIRLIRDGGEIAVTSAPWEDDRYRIMSLTSMVNPVQGARSADIPGTQAAVLAALAVPKPEKLTVVYVHGGEEYRALASDAEGRVWEGFIDAGADAVLVAHSHVPGDVRIYKGRPIFRGLGNLVFDQRDSVPTSTAKIVRLRKTDDRVLFETRLLRTP